ncbi:MAG: hypothetical protein RLW87_02730 [Alphaproteobacteria bacterium]|jgi:hypothetical protein|nr:hypothetical protein [Alphaproteobacteria bacterium]MBO6863494.1 hypothetical protein [Alphaproteobacteria bacterium]
MSRICGPIGLVTALFLFAATVPSATAQSTEKIRCGTAASLAFVRDTIKPKRHLAGMIMGVAQQTTTFNATLAEAQSRGFGQQMVGFYQKMLDQTLLMHTPSWECNLAAAYAAHLTDDQLTSLTAERQMSPAFTDLQTVKPQIDTQMRAKSEGILQSAVSEFLSGGVQFLQAYKRKN